MKRLWRSCRNNLLIVLSAWAVSAAAAGVAGAATKSPDESELMALGFKAIVATTKVQEEWVRSLPPGKMRPMQRNGKKYFVYPDAPRNQIYVGGPQEYEAYQQLYPDNDKPGDQEAANRAYRAKQDKVMREATARDLSDPFLGVTWADILY